MSEECQYCKELPLFSGKDKLPEVNVLMICRAEIAAGNLVYLDGNCPLEESEAVLQAETQYTVTHYFRCEKCGQLLLLGFCIRGKPFFKKVAKIETGLLRS
ncbi:hypothetical protein [uncultured Enterococcus sp.]|uniref:hypothetical protein n=1 Tax=uncultured Enterococcus sp. TaxID=167972 RepID=UPI002AA71604|nr:hypothetical protein [uncultured Enterococcus sp.]